MGDEAVIKEGDIMQFQRWTAPMLTGACAAALCAGLLTMLTAQQPPAGGRGGGRGGAATNISTAADADKDGAVSRDELRAAFAKWLADADAAKSGSVTQEQLPPALNSASPHPAPAAAF